MAHHNGSVIDHVHLRVADVEKRKRFCSAALSTLRLKLKDQDRSFFFGDEFFVEKADG
jgi:catechol-2,3-dioxygenase